MIKHYLIWAIKEQWIIINFIIEIIDKKKAHFEKNYKTQHSVVLSDLSPLSADTHTLINFIIIIHLCCE